MKNGLESMKYHRVKTLNPIESLCDEGDLKHQSESFIYPKKLIQLWADFNVVTLSKLIETASWHACWSQN